MHTGPVNKDHASALHGEVLFSSCYGFLVHIESTCLSICEVDNLEVLPVDGNGGSRCRLG